MKTMTAAALFSLLALAAVLPSPPGQAQSAPSFIRLAQATPPEQAPPRRIRPPVARLRVYPYYEPVPEVYPRYFPGRNAVRECNASYVQEYRPSGTVIVPRMSCRWRGG